MSNLPDLALERMFYYIPWKKRLILELVCKRWKSLVGFRDVDELDLLKDIPKKLVVNYDWDTVGEENQFGQGLYHAGIPADAIEQFFSVVLHKPGVRLRKLNLGSADSFGIQIFISRRAMEIVLSMAVKSLKFLQLFGFYENDVMNIVQQLQNLEFLTLRKVATDSLTEFADVDVTSNTVELTSLIHLRTLCCYHVKPIPPSSVSVLRIHHQSFETGNLMAEFFNPNNLPNLITLDVLNLALLDDYEPISIEYQHLQNLKWIADDIGAWPLFKFDQMPYLKSVNLSRENIGGHVSGISMVTFASLKQLEVLELEFEDIDLSVEAVRAFSGIPLKKLSLCCIVGSLSSTEMIHHILVNIASLKTLHLDFGHIFEFNDLSFLCSHTGLRRVCLKGVIAPMNDYVNVIQSDLIMLQIFDIRSDFEKQVFPAGGGYVADSMLARCRHLRSTNRNFRVFPEHMLLIVENLFDDIGREKAEELDEFDISVQGLRRRH